ncbi:MAG TPA: phenylacetate-CoA oxygenase subunit PaaC [Amphiplicatus sp.]|nr:phenylacetate-CoA oxygenase subunit PaaC [Amphiplicatus sp.]
MRDNPTIEFALRMGDNCLILAQQVGAWCGHAPVVEEDIAFANVALDLIGQTKLWLGYAGELEGKGRSADDLAFLRDVRQFRNCLLVEQPNDEFAKALMRQFLFDAWHHPMLTALTKSSNARIAEIAEKSVKEVSYHLERSHDLITRLGDGSPESHAKMQEALNDLWRFTGELMTPDSVDEALAADGAAPELSDIQAEYTAYMRSALEEATLVAPEKVHMYQGGKTGVHTEKLGHLVAEMQWMQRAYPGLKW